MHRHDTISRQIYRNRRREWVVQGGLAVGLLAMLMLALWLLNRWNSQ